ncbi:MAG: Crp/Fnr family transcriptional regulator [Desulfonatronovibrionaceae bacterium]
MYLKEEGKNNTDLEITGLLKELPLFSGLSLQELELLVRAAVVRTYPEQSRIISRGEEDSNLFVILSGRVRVRRGQEELAVLEKGDFFKEMALLTGEPWSADICAADTVTCLMIDREAFRVLLEMNPVVYENINRLFTERSRQAEIPGEGRKKSSADSFLARSKSIFRPQCGE